jgi:hypothetical protein
MCEIEYSVLDGLEDIALEVLEDQVDVGVMIGVNDLLDLDDIVVFELEEQTDLSIHPLRIGLVLKGQENLLDGEDGFALFASHLPHMAVSSTADLLQDIEAQFDLGFEEIMFISSFLLLLGVPIAHR